MHKIFICSFALLLLAGCGKNTSAQHPPTQSEQAFEKSEKLKAAANTAAAKRCIKDAAKCRGAFMVWEGMEGNVGLIQQLASCSQGCGSYDYGIPILETVIVTGQADYEMRQLHKIVFYGDSDWDKTAALFAKQFVDPRRK